jgi:uncharacterized repeat protein (TIGR03803 family)
VNLSGAVLQVTLGYTPSVGQQFTLIQNGSGSPVTGTFTGYAEGSLVTVGNVVFQITYQGGSSGQDVVLTVQGFSAPSPVSASGGFAFSAAEGTNSRVQTVASFTDPSPNKLLDYQATVNWGDGSTSVATLANGGIVQAGNTFSVNLSHHYAEDGTFTVTTVVTHEGLASNTATSTARVADVALTPGTLTMPSALDAGQSFSGTVYTFTDGNASNTDTSDFAAQVDPGDGSGVLSSATVGSGVSVVNTAAGAFSVVLTGHTYAMPVSGGTFMVTVTDGGGAARLRASSTLSVNPAVQITTATLPGWTQGLAGYSQTITATGGTGSFVFSSSGTLPPGLTFSSAGLLSGTPSAAGTYSFSATASDSYGGTAGTPYTVTINQAVAITTTSLPDWTMNGPPYLQTISATGGTGSLTFSSSGSLPAGLSLSTAGVLSGTSTAAGTYSFTVVANDMVGAAGSQSYTVTINPAVTIPQPFSTLASFTGSNGANSSAGLIEGSSGDLFGTTQAGGASGDGTVFELPYNSTTHAYGPIATIAVFNGTNGANPFGGLIQDSNGNLFGTTFAGGASGFGTVFEVPYNSSTRTYGSLATLAAFNDLNGSGPEAALIEDGGGDLFGTTVVDGPAGYGTVFELPYNSSTHAYGAITTVAALDRTDGQSVASLVQDSSGDLVGTTVYGGASSDGVVFEVPYNSSTQTFGSVTTFVTFNGSNGSLPDAGLIQDGSGNLFGTTAAGGAFNSGTVFELPYSGSTRTYGGLTTVAVFNSTDGNPQAGLVEDSNGNLYGTTDDGGAPGVGTVFEVAQGSGRILTLFTFHGTDGANPFAGLLMDAGGNLFGTTSQGGTSGDGTVFEVTPSAILPNWTVNRAGYVKTISASGGTGALTFTGSPPSGLTLSSAGVLSGTPSTAGTFAFTVTATDSLGASASSNFTVTINPAVTIATTSVADWTVGASGYNQTIGATGGTGSLTFSSSGTLPTGLSLTTAGVLSGTSTAPGTYSFTVTATDSLGAAGSQSYTVIINLPVTIPGPALTVTSGLGEWLRADAGVTANGSGLVSAWADQSGQANNASQGNASQQAQFVANAINGNPALSFNGIGDFYNLASQVLTSQQFTIFAVVSDTGTSTSGYREIFSNWDAATGNAVPSIFLGTANGTSPNRSARLSGDFGGSTGVGTITNPANPFVFSGVNGASDVSLYQNGTLFAQRYPLSPRNFSGPYVLGQQGNLNGEYWQGDIAEVLVYNRALGTAERQSVEAYLENKYFTIPLANWTQGAAGYSQTINATGAPAASPLSWRQGRCPPALP